MKKYSAFIKKCLDEITRDATSLGSLPIIILIMLFLLKDNFVLAMGIVTLLIVDAICSIIKLSWHKQRPKKMDHTNAFEKILAGSFPSVHMSRASFAYPYLFLKARTLFPALFLIIPLIVGYTRVKLNKHYWTDVVGGLIMGIAALYLNQKLFF